MNAIQSLEQQVLRRFPSARTLLDPSENPAGPWFLDIELDSHPVMVEWRPDRGFGVTSNVGVGYGEGPDEIHSDLESVSQRVITLLLAKTRTVPPKAVRLRELRAARRMSQMELAERLRIKQAAVSKLENRSDLHIRTLRDVIAAMGGQLIIRARFPDGMERELCFDVDSEGASSGSVSPGS
jgi:DNA-binding XRE family transcriptional regulator